MSLIDTHCHLDDTKYDGDREQVLERAVEAGVKTVITIGTSIRDSKWVCEFSAAHKNVFGTVGLHPEFAEKYNGESDIQIFSALAENKKIMAIGEVGLDYYHGAAFKDEQKTVFVDMIALAKEKKLPLVIHQRDAAEDTLEIMRDQNADQCGGVFHCFSADAKTAAAVLEMGFFIAVGGVLTFKSAAALREVIQGVPLNRLMLETDAPYLAPQKVRGKRNEPAFVVEIAKQLAEIKGIDLDQVVKVTTENAINLFGLESGDKSD